MTDKHKLLDNLYSTLELHRNRVNKLKSLLTQNEYRNKSDLIKELEQVQDAFSKAEETYNNFKDSAEDNWENIKEESLEIFNKLKDSLNQLLDKFPGKDLEKIKVEAIDSFKQLTQATESYIKQHPISTVLYGFAIGLLLGKLMK